jgi:uncharacterized protein YcsI (UPF0317 family)
MTVGGGQYGSSMAVAIMSALRPVTPGQRTSWVTVTKTVRCHYRTPTRQGFGSICSGELPIIWSCDVTLQLAIAAARAPISIAHFPGHMLVTDFRNSDLLSS